VGAPSCAQSVYKWTGRRAYRINTGRPANGRAFFLRRSSPRSSVAPVFAVFTWRARTFLPIRLRTTIGSGNEQNPGRGHRPGHHVLVRGSVAARQSRDHRQRPGEPDDAQLCGVHGLGEADRGRGQESGTRCHPLVSVSVLLSFFTSRRPSLSRVRFDFVITRRRHARVLITRIVVTKYVFVEHGDGCVIDMKRSSSNRVVLLSAGRKNDLFTRSQMKHDLRSPYGCRSIRYDVACIGRFPDEPDEPGLESQTTPFCCRELAERWKSRHIKRRAPSDTRHDRPSAFGPRPATRLARHASQ